MSLEEAVGRATVNEPSAPVVVRASGVNVPPVPPSRQTMHTGAFGIAAPSAPFNVPVTWVLRPYSVVRRGTGFGCDVGDSGTRIVRAVSVEPAVMTGSATQDVSCGVLYVRIVT